MSRLIFLVVLGCCLFRLVTGRWPWQAGARTLDNEALGRARALLGLRAGATRREIIEAHRRHIAMVHPDRGGSNEKVHEANAARDLLLASTPRDPQGHQQE